MEDKKVTKSELIRHRRVKELREFALAAFYPLTHSSNAAHLRRTDDVPPAIPAHHPLSRRRDNRCPPESAAKPNGEAVARVETPQVERPHRLEREHGHHGAPDEPKPWKKPWDK